MNQRADIAVVGAGAAGLFAAIWAGRTLRDAGLGQRVIALDGAKALGAKILVAGGGRCNVTHFEVDESAFAGSTPGAIRKVLRGFGVGRTVEFFRERGVELKREETGKLFPTTDSARTILDALLGAARDVSVDIIHPCRVESIERASDGFLLRAGGAVVGASPATPTSPEPIHARRLILATGGRSLPKTGSDGHGYTIARALGHTTTDAIFPALVPLTLDPARTFLTTLSGLTHTCTVDLVSGSGRKLVSFANSLLCTHFGLSGPAILDISRYYADARRADPGAHIVINWLPGHGLEETERALGGGEGSTARISVGRRLSELLPERLARALCAHTGVEPSTPLAQLRREDRRALARAATALPVPVTGDRGWVFAEVTAGGVPLAELRLQSMESRVCPGLHICGEICDVDGRIGGFNFQWAWASGYAAGLGAARALSPQPS